MSAFYLCDLCKHQHAKGSDYQWTELCDVGEVEPKVMSGGQNPTDACKGYEPKEDE